MTQLLTFHLQRYLAIAFLACLVGCSAATKMRDDSRDYVKQVGETTKTLLADDVQQGEVSLTFAEALGRAATMDPSLAEYVLIRKQLGVAREQAASIVWPRVRLRFGAQVPVGTSGGSVGDMLSGGLILEYDLMQALFVKEAVAAEEARTARLEATAMVRLREVAVRLMTLLAEVESDREQTRLLQERRTLLERRLASATTMAALDVSASDLARRCREALAGTQSQIRESSLRLETNRRALREMLGFRRASDVAIQDAVSVFQKLEAGAVVSIGLRESFVSAWNRRPEVSLAELDLFLAELQVARAGRGWLPQLAGSVGLGRMLLNNTNRYAPATVNLDVSQPVIDVGDIRRQKKSAELDRDIMRLRAVNLARSLLEELQSAHAREAAAEGQLRDAKDALAASEEYWRSCQELLKARCLLPSEALSAQLSMAEAAVAERRAAIEAKLAQIAAAAAEGDPALSELLAETCRGLWTPPPEGKGADRPALPSRSK